MLKARSATCGASAIATVGAELGSGVAALTRQGRIGKNLAHRVPCAHIAGGVGPRGFADWGLVHKHHFGELLGAQQAIESTGCLGGFAKVAQQGRGQHVLNQSGFARTRYTGHTHESPQRDLYRDILQVVLARALQNQARRVVTHQALEAHAHLLAPAQVGTRQGVGMSQVIGGAIEHNVPAALARAGAHVDHAVGGKHHGRVMLDNDQRVAGVAQALHRLDDAVHVTRVQADAGFVQHEQGVDQRGAQCGGEVDALHLAARQRAALPVQREVTDAHIAQITQTRADFFEQQAQRFGFCL